MRVVLYLAGIVFACYGIAIIKKNKTAATTFIVVAVCCLLGASL